MTDAYTLALQLVDAFKARGWMVATAESCTGGLIAGAITDVAGSSAVLDRGFVTYSNEAKAQMLGVPPALIETHGAVSAPVAAAMAAGAIRNSPADIAVSVTGIAGPDGGSADKPVGTVWFGLCARGQEPDTFMEVFEGLDRSGVRQATVETALRALLSC